MIGTHGKTERGVSATGHSYLVQATTIQIIVLFSEYTFVICIAHTIGYYHTIEDFHYEEYHDLSMYVSLDHP